MKSAPPLHRREFLRLAGAGIALALPGCASLAGRCGPGEAAVHPPRQLSSLDTLANTRDVDLDAKAPRDRWRAVLEKDREALRAVSAFMVDKAMTLPAGLIVPIVASIAYPQYREHGYFIDDSDMFAEETDVPRDLMAFLQRQYTWIHAYCTTASAWDPVAREMVMLRSLDWPGADALAPATRIHRLVRGGRPVFVSAGLTGMVGVLTGVKPGAFAIAINYAKVSWSARPAADPTFLIRQLLEDPAIDSFAKAQLVIGWWRPGAPCFISLTGIAHGEASVFEFHRGWPPGVRRMPDAGYLVQTNHFDDSAAVADQARPGEGTCAGDAAQRCAPGECFDADLIETSRLRRRMAENGLAVITKGGGERNFDSLALDIWKSVPILNHETVHFAIIRPSRDDVAVWTTTRVAQCAA